MSTAAEQPASLARGTATSQSDRLAVKTSEGSVLGLRRLRPDPARSERLGSGPADQAPGSSGYGPHVASKSLVLFAYGRGRVILSVARSGEGREFFFGLT